LLSAIPAVAARGDGPGVAKTPRPRLDAPAHFPLTAGASWWYDVIYDSLGRSFEFGYRVRSRSGDDYKGRPSVRLDTSLATGKRRKEVLQREHYSLSPSGDVLCLALDNGSIHVPFAPPQVLLKNGALAGEAWTWEGTFKGRQARSTTRFVGPRSLSLKGRRFDCIVIEIEARDAARTTALRRRLWFARGAGLVQELCDDLREGAPGRLEGRLSRWDPPGPTEPRKE
jgi:hypothetical protein